MGWPEALVKITELLVYGILLGGILSIIMLIVIVKTL